MQIHKQMTQSTMIVAALLASLAISAVSCGGDETSHKKATTTTTTTKTTTSSTTTTPNPTSPVPDETTDESDATSTTTTTTSKPSPSFDDIDEAELKLLLEKKPEFASIVEKIKAGDAKAKEQYEQILLSIRYKKIKANKSHTDSDYDVVLNFIDDHVLRLASSTGPAPTQEPLIKLKDLLLLVNVSDEVKERIKDLGGKFEAAECGSECLSREMSQIMTEAMGSMMGPEADSGDVDDAEIAANTDSDPIEDSSENRTIDDDIGDVDGKNDATDEVSARNEL